MVKRVRVRYLISRRNEMGFLLFRLHKQNQESSKKRSSLSDAPTKKERKRDQKRLKRKENREKRKEERGESQ